MSTPPEIRLSATTIGAPDARALGRFYRQLLGWDVVDDHPEWVTLRPPTGGSGLSFMTESGYVPPVWPAAPDQQQMMLHLDLQVHDLQAAGQHAEACGATLAAYQPQEDVRVYRDPAGHPFCLFLPASSA